MGVEQSKGKWPPPKYIKDVETSIKWGLEDCRSLSTPIHFNPEFLPGLEDNAFLLWSEKGICTIRDLVADGTVKSFNQLIEQYDLPSRHWFRYLQVRSQVIYFNVLFQVSCWRCWCKIFLTWIITDLFKRKFPNEDATLIIAAAFI